MLGFSEGTDVAAVVAASSKGVDRLGFMSGGGPTQAFDFFVMIRKQLRGKDPAMVEVAITQLQQKLQDVFTDPTSHTKMLFGHPYSRWAAYFRRPPIESLVKVSVPIFVAHGSADQSVPIESADFIAAEFIRLGKKNLTYRRYPGLDHSFYSCSRRDKDCD
ncbi:MAG: prolyl oligopeptidase family serine peptidase, partial [Deltaproteobacteria bacterium]|nr:prolyl oligopeptidase family serine peptidase [Deltaproteobacteria bacterium]